MNQSPRYLIRLMEERGWVFKRIKGSHHIYFQSATNETMPIPVHDNRDIGKGLLLKIIKKVGISIDDLNG